MTQPANSEKNLNVPLSTSLAGHLPSPATMVGYFGFQFPGVWLKYKDLFCAHGGTCDSSISQLWEEPECAPIYVTRRPLSTSLRSRIELVLTQRTLFFLMADYCETIQLFHLFLVSTKSNTLVFVADSHRSWCTFNANQISVLANNFAFFRATTFKPCLVGESIWQRLSYFPSR